jgi:hypothetical protein
MNLIIGIIHWLFIFYDFFYPILIKNYLFDKIYVIIFILKNISWLVFDNECIISLFVKQQIDKNYKPGDNVFDLDDMRLISPMLTTIFVNYLPIVFILTITLFYIVSRRSNILDNNSLMVVLFIHIFFVLYVRKFYNEKLYNKLNIDYFAPYVKNIFIIILSYIIFNILNNKK